MPASAAEFDLLVWSMRSGAFLLAAVCLIKTGYWPRRTGADPHCRRCDYNLANAPADRCPECGTAFGPGRVRVGRRDRIAWRTAAGLVCAAIAILSLWYCARTLLDRARLQRYLPASVVVWNLSDPDAEVAERALLELSVRWKRGRLDRDALQAMIEHCIRVLDSESAAAVPGGVYILRELIESDTVSTDQWQRITQAGARVRLAVPEFVEVGRVYPARFELETRLPGLTVFLDKLLLDDRPQPFESRTLVEADLRPAPVIQFATEGPHALRAKLRREFMVWNPETWRPVSTLPGVVRTEEIRVEAFEFDAFDARLAKALSEAVEFVQATKESRHLVVDVRVKQRLPVPVRIEVLIDRDPPVALGQQTVSAGSAGVFSIVGPYPGMQTDSLNVLVRLTNCERLANENQVVRHDAEFRFPNCRILRSKRPTPAQ